jgi:hypothetical protein
MRGTWGTHISSSGNVNRLTWLRLSPLENRSMINWEQNGPTIEDDIRANADLSSVQKELLIKRSKIKVYRQILGAILVLLVAGLLSVFFKGWVQLAVFTVVVFGSLFTHMILEDAEKRIESELADEEEAVREAKRESRRQARERKRQQSGR